MKNLLKNIALVVLLAVFVGVSYMHNNVSQQKSDLVNDIIIKIDQLDSAKIEIEMFKLRHIRLSKKLDSLKTELEKCK